MAQFQVKSVAVYLASSGAAPEPFHRLAQETGEALARSGLGVVYGGASCGLMGRLADAALAAGGEVVGVIPQHLVDRELAHRGVTELVLVASMHERKQVMADRSDAVAVLPGGFGTLDEAFEALTWRQLGFHGKPVVFVEPPGIPYWAPLFAWAEGAVAAGLLRPEHAAYLERVEGAEGLLERLAREPAHGGHVPKWV